MAVFSVIRIITKKLMVSKNFKLVEQILEVLVHLPVVVMGEFYHSTMM